MDFIEMKQLEKRELGLKRDWGDSFFEEIVEDKHKKERENIDVQPGRNPKQRDREEEKPIMLVIN